MSEFAIRNYLNELNTLKRLSSGGNESSIRQATIKLIDEYAKGKDLRLVAEVAVRGKLGKAVIPDGTLKDNLVLAWGYWESKDEMDDLEAEIEKKSAKGYPDDNILYEDSTRAILIQNGIRVLETRFEDVERFDKLLKAFVNFERPEVREFRQAIELFKRDVPIVTEALRELIIREAESNKKYCSNRDSFLELLRDVVNPAITKEDIREMVIQHILTADIFNTIFDEPYFHQENNIARELEKLVNTFFSRDLRHQSLATIKHYYDTINARAAQIADHHEKQKFLKVVYETFYKSYNSKKADRLGVVYTPNEIVRFMIHSTDYLLHKHFGKMLEDHEVEILDPATGTGTFICDIIDHIASDKLEYKYRHELHANEVEILPYYIANLNIEFTYKQKMQSYAEFENLCFVDTLDNYVNVREGGEQDIFSVTDENAERIKRQNERKISVIIGNPPYNANQMNENENNKNRAYPKIDKRIKDTYIKHSTAQKTKVYDMYARFYRWAMDRLDQNGVIAYITNRSFIDSRTFDGFRKIVSDEFDFAYIIDTRSDVRQNPKISGTANNVFGIQTGVAIMFLVRLHPRVNKQCRISYFTMQDEWRKDDKLQWLCSNALKDIPFTHIEPDKNNNWINLTDNDWEELMPVADKSVKLGSNQNAVFSMYSLGLVTNRDEWVYDYETSILVNKVATLIDTYNNASNRADIDKNEIKWTRAVKKDLMKGVQYQLKPEQIQPCNYRPYVVKVLYYSQELNEMRYQMPLFFPTGSDANNLIAVNCMGSRDFSVLGSNRLCDLHFIGDSQCLPLYTYSQDGTRNDNITDWAMAQFREHYEDQNIGKEDIFHYVYGALHNPAYRQKYEQNLKRSLPRIPFYEDFWQWVAWGKELMDLHIGFETVDPYPLTRWDALAREDGSIPKAKLKADKEHGTIVLDEDSSLTGIPDSAWEYKLGNRSALEWILDQYKEKKPKDPTIAERFNTYRFTDYKEQVIQLLMRVCTVSVKTVEIIRQMKG
ncbi:MAG: N-6 DNA methylase [Candidatus Cloacimonetes bacterium]|nr:N-6 DNA methylase [Candidatus Cloacimonadota bacterium]